jgi:hypothetical protein
MLTIAANALLIIGDILRFGDHRETCNAGINKVSLTPVVDVIDSGALHTFGKSWQGRREPGVKEWHRRRSMPSFSRWIPFSPPLRLG